MRRGRNGGLCAVCGDERDDGLFWENYLKVLDFGVDTMPPMEPDTTEPVRCDRCEFEHRVRTHYADDPIDAQRTYWVAPCDVERYLRLKREGKVM